MTVRSEYLLVAKRLGRLVRETERLGAGRIYLLMERICRSAVRDMITDVVDI